MVGFKSILYALAFFSLFAGIISGLSLDILRIIASPFDPNVYKLLAIDFAKIVFNSQNEIKVAVNEFEDADPSYRQYLLSKIIAGTILTLFMIWIIYKAIRWGFEAPSLSTKILIILVSILSVWFIGVIASVILGKPNFVPFSGWIELIKQREIIINYILQTYEIDKSLNSRRDNNLLW